MDKAEKLFNDYLSGTETDIILEFNDAVVCSSNMDILKEVVASEKKRNRNSIIARLHNRPMKYKIEEVERSKFYTARVYDCRYDCAVKIDYKDALDNREIDDKNSSLFICATSPERLKQIAKPVFYTIDEKYQSSQKFKHASLFDVDVDMVVSAVINGIETPISKRYERGVMLNHSYDAFEYLVDAYVNESEELER